MPDHIEPAAKLPAVSATATIVLAQPVGTVTAFYGAAKDLIPGWLLCDGSPFDGVTYPLLANLLEQTTTPDLRGYFIRGFDPTGVIDKDGASRRFADIQQDEVGPHTHTYGKWQDWHIHRGFSGGGNDFAVMPEQTGDNTGKETRPKNIALNYIVFAGFPVTQTS